MHKRHGFFIPQKNSDEDGAKRDTELNMVKEVRSVTVLILSTVLLAFCYIPTGVSCWCLKALISYKTVSYNKVRL